MPARGSWHTYAAWQRLSGEVVGARHLTARFVAGQPAASVVEGLAMALGAHVERNGRVVTLRAGPAR